MKKFLKKIINQIGFTRYYPYQILSFSQCGEDLIISFLFQNLLKINKPSYIDIGAHHPFWINNTTKFYLNGSRGINIEPDPELLKKFLKHRKNDINLNIAISNKEGKQKFYIMSSPTVNTLYQIEVKKFEKIDNTKIKNEIYVKVDTLPNILTNYFNSEMPDFLSLDVEGYELNILKTVDFESHRPKVMCVETADINKNKETIKRNDLIEFIKSKDYMLYADTRINSIFLDNKLGSF